MIFDKTFLVALLAATAVARPYAQQDEEPSATDGMITSTAAPTAEPTETAEPITSIAAPTTDHTETTESITSTAVPTTEHTETTGPITSTSAAATGPTQPASSSASVPATQTSSSPSTSSSASAGTGNGGVQIVNNLGRDVYVRTGNGGVRRVSAGGTLSHDWATDGTGVSLKMGTSASSNSVLQFEYTANGDLLYWDVSSIDLNPNSDIVKSGFTVTPSDSSCKSVTCAAGDTNCADSYQTPSDLNTNSCSTSAQYVVALG